MDITIQNNEKVVTAILSGRLDSLAAPDAETTLLPLMEEEGLETLVLDCSQLDYIASSGLRLFFTLLKQGRAQGVRVVLKRVNDFVREVLDSTGLSAMFEFE